jgi:hypothetical protein
MPKTFEDIRSCVRTKVRAFCFADATITDNQIGATKVSDLRLDQNSNMPGVSPRDALAIQMRSCTDVGVPNPTGDDLQKNPNWTVDTIAQSIYGQTI